MKGEPGELEAILGHAFRNRELLKRAITHRSVTGEKDRHGYQRLEFLGDRILGAAVATMVFRQFPGEAEGELSLRFTKLVRNETLTEIALELGIDRFIVIGKGEELNGMRRSPSILADILEALIGALYLDGGFAMAHAFVRTCWQDRVASGTGTGRDGKTRLQEWALERGLALPGYSVLEKAGPSHAPLITVEVCVEGFECVQAQGRSRRAAERQAAEIFLAGMAC